MAIYYVATLAKYVLVEAADEAEAQRQGMTALEALQPGAPVRVRTVRLATADEIELQRWHEEAAAAERERS